ncbi:MASE1 domain-containing protein [Actinopolymorpha sp. B17G11]|uniref:MASE1 domain-containing protein n=1 Tax=Actinopolymorpha sp. B17G11 TaxID=3160861 RepID=UPI0032E45B27
MTDGSVLKRYVTTFAPAFVVGVAYYAAARIGLLQELVNGQVTPLWPPTGIALVGLLLFGLRTWPGIAVAALVVNMSVGPIAAAVAISVGNTLAPVCAYFLLRRVGFRVELDRRRDALALIFLAAMVGMAVSATIGAGALVLTGVVSPADFAATWSVWWTGDAMGVLVVAPFLLALRAVRTVRALREIRLWRWIEFLALLAGTFVVTAVATRTTPNVVFLVSPFLIWAALRFQLAGAAPCALVVSVVTIQAVASGSVPFADTDLLTSMVILQAFNASAALTALILATIIAERNQAYAQVELACVRLAEVVSQLDRGRLVTALIPPVSSPTYEPSSGADE